jgi:hypothetical protein
MMLVLGIARDTNAVQCSCAQDFSSAATLYPKLRDIFRPHADLTEVSQQWMPVTKWFFGDLITPVSI